MELRALIAALEAEDAERVLPLGFTNPHSYRGYYEQLAFEPATDVAVGDMLKAAKSTVGTTYEGWKGGDFTMHARTDCWLAEEGHGSGEEIGPVLLTMMLASDELSDKTQARLRALAPACWGFPDDKPCVKRRNHEGSCEAAAAT